MRVIVAGSRAITDPAVVEKAIEAAAKDTEARIEITTLLSGHAPGVGLLAEAWAAAHDIPVEVFPADWEKYGRSAGPIRNATMARRAQACILVWDRRSSGTRHMMLTARARGLQTYLFIHSLERGHHYTTYSDHGWHSARCSCGWECRVSQDLADVEAQAKAHAQHREAL